MITTRIRDTPYKKRLSSLEESTIVKVRGPQGKFILHEDYSNPALPKDRIKVEEFTGY